VGGGEGGEVIIEVKRVEGEKPFVEEGAGTPNKSF